MTLGVIVVLMNVWNIVGCILCLWWFGAIGWELCNPYWAYKLYRNVNWFGAITISLFCTLLCPVGAIIYWFCELCTIGRK